MFCAFSVVSETTLSVKLKSVHVFSNFGGSLISLLRQVTRTKSSVFSPAYLRHVGPTSLQFRIPFGVGIALIQKL